MRKLRPTARPRWSIIKCRTLGRLPFSQSLWVKSLSRWAYILDAGTRRGRQWKADLERAPVAFGAVHGDGAAVRIHDGLGDRQPEARSRDGLLGSGLAAEEPLEDWLQVRGRD